jgi:hypothetical protein
MSEEEENHDETKGGIDLHVLRSPYLWLKTERYRDSQEFVSKLQIFCRFPKHFEDFCATITKCFAIKKASMTCCSVTIRGGRHYST